MTIYLITNAVKRQKLHVHLSIVLQLLGDCIPLADFSPPNPLCPPYFQTLATLLLKLREIFLGVKSSIKEIYEN